MLHSEEYYSPSSWLQKKLKFYSDVPEPEATKFPSEQVTNFRLRRGLHQLARVVNIVENASNGNSERNLSLRWSDGTFANHPGSKYVNLDPDKFLNISNENQAIDSMTGFVLLASNMKRTMDMNAFVDYYTTKQFEGSELAEKAATHLFEANEASKARRNVLDDWKGFKPYFDAHQKFSGAANREAVQDVATNFGKESAEAFSIVAGWNVLFPTARVEFDDRDFNLFLQQVEAMVAMPHQEENDFRHQVKVGNSIVAFIDEKKNEQEPYGGESEDEPDNSRGESFGTGTFSGDSQGEQPQQDGSSPQGGDKEEAQEKDFSDFNLVDKNVFGELIPGDPNKVSEINLNDSSIYRLDAENNIDYYPDIKKPLVSLGISRVSSTVSSSYDNIARSVKNISDGIKKTLSFHKTAKQSWLHALEEGDLDEGSLHKISQKKLNIFSQKQIQSKADVAINLLVDMSGSMGGNKIISARELAVAFTEALKDFKGVNLIVSGHTADMSSTHFRGERVDVIQDGSTVAYAEYFSKHHKNPYAIAHMNAYQNNYDGYAIECASRRLLADYPNVKQRIVLVISDGRPCNGMEHVKGSVETAKRRMGVDVYGIGIENAYTYQDGIDMYGEGRSVVIPDTLEAVSIITPFLKKVLNRI